MDQVQDVVVIGAGIVGLATAMKLQFRHPDWQIAVLEKEPQTGVHQTGHNSGVIHSGLYYQPGSLKARLCVSGVAQLIGFCREHGLPFEICGKLVAAADETEVPALRELHRRGTANGVPGLRILDSEAVRTIEPHCRARLGLHVPTTGITDFGKIAGTYARVFAGRGGQLLFRHRVLGISVRPKELVIHCERAELICRRLINCAGLYADQVARFSGIEPACRIVPFRGEYYALREERRQLLRHLIYPVPDPRFPFLGVHLTRMIDGRVEAGPNAVLAWAREGYCRSTVNRQEMAELFRFAGFWRLCGRYWRAGCRELLQSFSKARFADALRRLVPEVATDDLVPGGAGVRAQAVGPNGALLSDFVLQCTERTVHVLNAPSPAATCSLAIADHIVNAAGL
jgi:L-2-hydroxyglutarate oxidase LhgO